MTHCTIGVLIPQRGSTPPATPASLPLGRAAIQLSSEGIRVVFGADLQSGVLTGSEVVNGSWSQVRATLDAAWDRFPSQSRPEQFAELLSQLTGRALGNPPALTALCRDKRQTQRVLEAAGVEMPALVCAHEDFDSALASWPEGAFLKPRHGSFGRGVRFVRRGDPTPARGPGAVLNQQDELLLQRAITAPRGWSGISVRQLVQRTPEGWHLCTPAVRRHRSERVVNVAKEAEVAPGPDALAAETLSEMDRIAHQVIGAMGADPCSLELGLDYAIDPELRPWLIEVNARPRGHLRVLAELDAERFAQEHIEACARPLRFLSATIAAQST